MFLLGKLETIFCSWEKNVGLNTYNVIIKIKEKKYLV